MTCIVGLVEKNTVYIGGDSAGVVDYDLTSRADEKVFRNGPFLMGFTSSFRMGQLLRYTLQVPPRPPEQDVFAFMVTGFVDAVRDCLKAGGYARRDNEVERGGTFLVGYQGRLFKVDSDYQVGEPRLPYDACGCGEAYALGALHAARSLPLAHALSPLLRVRMALAAAEQFSAGVAAPFTILSLPKEV